MLSLSLPDHDLTCCAAACPKVNPCHITAEAHHDLGLYLLLG